MSMPVGQSRAQPLQDRHRSSASSTAGSSKVSVPLTTSWSTRARPRVESFSSRVARNDGHITPPLPVLSAMHLPTPVQRWTASLKDPESWVSFSVVRTGRMGAARRRSASNGAGSTRTPGLSRLPGSRIRLACCISAIACG